MEKQPMCKRLSNETMCKQLITMVNCQNASMDELIKVSGRSRSTIYKLFSEHYSDSSCLAHKKLLKKLRENNSKVRKSQMTEKTINNQSQILFGPSETVIVTETGALLEHFDKIQAEGKKVFLPRFCSVELSKIGSPAAANVLVSIYSAPNIFKQIDLQNEILGVEPSTESKKRDIGVVALCCEIWSHGGKVKLLTTSHSIEQLALMQEFGPNVEIIFMI